MVDWRVLLSMMHKTCHEGKLSFVYHSPPEETVSSASVSSRILKLHYLQITIAKNEGSDTDSPSPLDRQRGPCLHLSETKVSMFPITSTKQMV